MSHFAFAAVLSVTFFISSFAGATAFDDKARAAAEQEQRIAASNAYAAKLKELNENNQTMVRRVPRGATITQCFDILAFRYRHRSNGCNLVNTSWNGYPVQVCADGYGYNQEQYPPEIVECHYHVTRTGQDCRIVRNPTVQPQCY